jgi:hypothetical protein
MIRLLTPTVIAAASFAGLGPSPRPGAGRLPGWGTTRIPPTTA